MADGPWVQYGTSEGPWSQYGQGSADVGPAVPANAQSGVTSQGIKEGGIITEPDSGGIGGLLHRAGQVVEGSFMGSNLQGFGGWVARNVDKIDGYAGTPWETSKLDPDFVAKYPEQAKALQTDYERKNMLQKRQQYAGEVAANSQGINPLGFAASVAGSVDPTWAINPGAGLVKGMALSGAEKVGAHIAANAGAHAVMGSADDAAYQVADEIDGLQKGFDIKRNLEAAAMQGTFGAAHAGITELAPHVSDFVTDLYKQRGTDTTPSETPQGLTTPLTGQGLSPEETAQYHEVLKTGDVQDIRGFFDGRNTPPPSFADAHEWVQRRDAVNDGIAPSDYADDMFKPIPPEVDQRPAVEQHIQNETANWKNAPDFEVINHTDDIQDPAVRQQAINEGADHPDALGFLGGDGKVRVFANRISDPDQLNSVIYHEALGHYGLAQQFGDKLDSTLQTLMDRNVGQFGKDVDEYQKVNPGAYNGDRVRAAEEVLANQSNNGVIKPSIVDALTSHVRNFGRKMGLDLSYSDGEVRTILGMAHNSVINGNGRNVVANGFRMEGQGQQQSDTSMPTALGASSEPIEQPIEAQSAETTPMASESIPEIVGKPSIVPTETGQPIVHQIVGTNKFIRRSDLAPKDVAEEAYERLGKDYAPKYRSWEDAKSTARDTPLDPAKVMASRSVGNLDKKLFIYDAAAKEANTVLSSLADKAEIHGLTDEEHVLGMETAAHFNYVLGRLENDATQIARGLNAMKAISFSRNNLLKLRDALEKGETNMDALTDSDTMLKFLKQYKALSNGNPNGAASLVRGVTQPYWWQYLLSWRQNMMLSGLSTHLKSTMDMATTAGRDLEEKIIAMPAYAVREGLRSLGVKNIQPGLHPSEFAMHLWGLTRAALDAQTYKDTANAFMTGGQQRFTNTGTPSPRIPVVSKVTDAIAAQDAFFRGVLNNQNLYALGARKALQEAKANGTSTKWDDLTTIGSNHARAPTKAMLDEARELTENTMLLNKSPLNSGIDNIKRIRPGMTGTQQLGSFMINYLTPFIRVQSNALMNQIVRRSPLSFLDPVTKADWAAGGARRDVAIARTILGTAILANAWNAAAPDKHKITGEGPANLAKLKELEASGYSPNSVHENGRYNKNSNLNISLNPFDLHNNTASLVAGVREAYEEGKSAKDLVTGLKLASAAIMHDLVSQVFINDLGEAYDAFSGKGEALLQKSGKFIGNEAKSFLPNATTQLAKIVDPNAHDTSDGIGAQLQSAIPGATQGLPIRYNVYGQPMKTGTSPTGIHTWLSNGNGQTETTDPTEKELNRLANLTKAAIITPTQRSMKVEGASVKLTASQAEDYQKYAGQTTVQAITDQMNSGDWQKMSDQDKVNEIRSVQTQAKKEVRETLLEKDGWLNSDQLTDLRTQLNGK